MIADRLKRRRKELKLSQDDVAKKLGITRQGYSHYETGRNEPDNETLIKLSEILNCSTDYLLGKTNDPTPAPQQKQNINTAFYNLDELTEEEKKYLDMQLEIFRKLKEERNKN